MCATTTVEKNGHSAISKSYGLGLPGTVGQEVVWSGFSADVDAAIAAGDVVALVRMVSGASDVQKEKAAVALANLAANNADNQVARRFGPLALRLDSRIVRTTCR